MGKTLNLMVKNLQSFVEDCYDTIALFLCLHLILRYNLTCHKRAVPALDKYWDNMTSVIWPRYLNFNIIIIIVIFDLLNKNSYILLFKFLDLNMFFN